MRTYDRQSLRRLFSGAFAFGISPAHTSEGHRYERQDTKRKAWSVTTKLAFKSKPYLYRWYVKMALEHVSKNKDRLSADIETVIVEARDAATRSRDTSAEIGTTAHDTFDAYLRSWIEADQAPQEPTSRLIGRLCAAKGVEPRGEEIAACRSFDKFIAENEIIPLASEIRIWYEKGKDCFAGTVDAIFLWLEVYKGREGETGCAQQIDPTMAQGHDYAPQENGNYWCATCGREVTPRLVLGDHKTSNSIKEKDEYAQQSVAYAKAIEAETGLKFDDIWVMRYSKDKADYEICRVANRRAAWKEILAVSRAFDAEMERSIGDSIEGKERLLVPLQERNVITL